MRTRGLFVVVTVGSGILAGCGDSEPASPQPDGAGGLDGAGGAAMGGAGTGGGSSGGAGTGGAGTGGAGTGGASAGGTSSGGTVSGGDPELPLVRADGFVDMAPPIGQPLPAAAAGTWTWVDIPEMKCRDGSAGGLYVRYSATSSNYYVYLEGGGVCLNDFFCSVNPKNIDQSQKGETLVEGATMPDIRQEPGAEGIFKNDARNPVADWNAVYVPYCTGDIWGGNKPDATFPPEFAGALGQTEGVHQFVGFANTSVVLGRVVATFTGATKTLLTGSSAGGIGALLNAHRLADLYRQQGREVRGYVVSDSAVPFADQYLAPCTQQTWRDLWNLDPSFPSDCADCFPQDGGSLATSLGAYFLRKFPDQTQVLGGFVSSREDQIIRLFYGAALPGCTPTSYGDPAVYTAAIRDFRDDIVDKRRFGTYFLEGSLHMHLWRPRFYETNGNVMSIADWLGKILNNEAAHIGD